MKKFKGERYGTDLLCVTPSHCAGRWQVQNEGDQINPQLECSVIDTVTREGTKQSRGEWLATVIPRDKLLMATLARPILVPVSEFQIYKQNHHPELC